MKGMTIETKEVAGVPWDSHADMMACLNSKEARHRLVSHLSSKGFSEKPGSDFLKTCFTKDCQLYILQYR